MSNELMVAIVGLLGSFSGSIIGAIGSAKVITYRVTQLENRMKEQLSTCSVMDGRVDRIEARQDVMDEKIKVANHRIDDIEKWREEKQ